MGNQIVIPSMGNWFIDPLKRNGITVQSVLESGTFFLTLDCIDSQKNSIIVKAYESNSTIENNNIYQYCIEYNTVLKNSNLASKGISIYTDIITKQNLAFLCRKKHQFTLTQRLEEYPPLEPIEKQWIAFKFIKLVLNLHKKNLFHGSINPDNVFVDSELQINLGDMAPFKPSYIKNTRPDLFHHLFTTVSRSSCYLAPEQLLSPDGASDMLNFNGTFEMDYFAAGLVLYYLYTGEHLFTFLRLHQYKSGQINIDKQIEKLPDEIRKLVSFLLSLNPSERKLCSKDLNNYFPEIFHDIGKYFSLFLNPNRRFKYKIKIDIKEISIDQRLIFINLFLSLLNKSRVTQRKVKFASFICHYASPLSDMVKLNRVLPYFCNMLTIRANIIKCTALSCIVKLIQSIKTIPDELSAIFSSYLIPFIFKIGSGASVQFRSAMASLCPVLAVEIERLQPESDAKAMEMVNFIINEEHTIVVGAFVETMKALSQPNEPESFIYIDLHKDCPVKNVIPLIIELSREVYKKENDINLKLQKRRSSQIRLDNQNQANKNSNINRNTSDKSLGNEATIKHNSNAISEQKNIIPNENKRKSEAKRKQSIQQENTKLNQKKSEISENQSKELNIQKQKEIESNEIQLKKEESNDDQNNEGESNINQEKETEINIKDSNDETEDSVDQEKEADIDNNEQIESTQSTEDIEKEIESNVNDQSNKIEESNDKEKEADIINDQKDEIESNEDIKDDGQKEEEELDNETNPNISQELQVDSNYQSSDDEDFKYPTLMNISPIIPQDTDEFGSYSDNMLSRSNGVSPSSSPNFSSISFGIDNDNESGNSNPEFTRTSTNSIINSFSLISTDEKPSDKKDEEKEDNDNEAKKEDDMVKETENENKNENGNKFKNKSYVKRSPSFLLQSGNLSLHSPKPLVDLNENIDKELVHRCKFETFEHFSTILISCLNSNYANYKVRILHIFIAFYDNSPIHERCYFRRLYSTIAPLLLGFLGDDSTNSNPTMIEGYLEFILWYVQRNLLSKVYIPELFLRLSKYRKSDVAVFRFYAEKIMSYLPQEFDAEKVTTFINQILFPQKQLKSDNRRISTIKNAKDDLSSSDSNTVFGLGTMKNYPLMIKAGLSIKPKFIDSFKVSRQPIRVISPHFLGDLRSVISDEDGTLYNVTKTKQIEKCPKSIQINKKILTMVQLRNNNKTCMICNDRTLNYIDWKAMKIIQSRKIPSIPVKIDSRDQNIVYILCQNRNLYMVDMRMGRSLNISFNRVLSPSALTFWWQSPAIGIGFKEGFVDLFDPRIMLVFKSIVTEPVSNLAPVQRSACNFAVASDDKVLFYNASSDNESEAGAADLSIYVDSPFVNSYDGNAIITGVNDVYHIDCENFEKSTILGDFYQKKILGIKQNSVFRIERNICGYGSLHKHASKITCVDHNQELFMSGDINGFVNIWSLSGS